MQHPPPFVPLGQLVHPLFVSHEPSDRPLLEHGAVPGQHPTSPDPVSVTSTHDDPDAQQLFGREMPVHAS
jgi:hypothetical protein